MKQINILILILLVFSKLQGQQTYTRTFKTDSVGNKKWQIIETEVYAVAIEAGDTTKTITQKPIRFETRKEMLDFLRSSRATAIEQKTTFQNRIVELDSQITSIRRILRTYGDNRPDGGGNNRDVNAPQSKSAAAAITCPCDMYVTTRTQKDECIAYLKVLQDMGIEAPKQAKPKAVRKKTTKK